MNKTGKILVLSILSLILLVSVVSTASTTGDGTDNIKLDPFLRRLIEDQKPSGAFEIKSLDTLKTVSVIIRADSGEDISSELKGVEGVEVHSIIGDIITADVPISAIKTIASISGVVYIEASKPLKLLLDKSVPATNANEVWNVTYKGQNITGKDVIVAVIDTGIDWTHGDFKKSDGTTRILYIWDQTLTAQAGETDPQPYNYGVEYTQAQINASLAGTGTVREQDTDGHGTHCAGIAAGNGLSTSPPTYIGMAPEADIIVVKSNLTTATVIDAMNYTKNKAQALEKPVVISCSFGAHWDAHDGTTSEEKVIDTLSGKGTVFVVAAGNEAEDDIHASGTVTQGEPMTTNFYVPVSAAESELVVVNIWYNGSDSMNVSVTAPTISTSPQVSPGTFNDWDTPKGGIYVDAERVQWSENGDNQILIILYGQSYNATNPIATGTWSFTLYGNSITNGRFDAWLPVGEGESFTTNIDSNVTIGEPATANKAIAVGAYTTKPSDEYGQIASFSSKGPTRDGRQKPEITAPGKSITSARSGGGYTPKSGTSMSCPHVAGAVALMLQVNSTLDSATISNIIKDTAATDAFTGSTWNPTWGWGKLDAKAAVSQLDNTPPTYSQVSRDNTEVGEPALLSAYWCDDIGLNGFNLSTNNSGVWVNTSYPMTGQCNWSNATITLNSTAHSTIGWIIYAKDTFGNWNNTGVQTILTADTKPPIVTGATANPPTIFADGAHETLLNVTATDISGIKNVTVNLSAIGKSETQELQNNNGVWQCTTNTTINGTFELPVNVTDNEGNSNINATIALEAVPIGTDLIFTYRDSSLTTPADIFEFENNATVFVLVTDGNTTGGNKTITVNNTYSESINVTVYDNGTNGGDIASNDKNYTGHFNITSGATNDTTDELRLNEGDTATITANLANDSLAGTKTISRATKCFIATAAYGTSLHENIDILRSFRDKVLMQTSPGGALVTTYYSTSPPIADALAKNEGLRSAVRLLLLTPLVYFAEMILSGIGLIAIVFLGLGVFFGRRRYIKVVLKAIGLGLLTAVVLTGIVFALGWLAYTYPVCAVIAAHILPLIIPAAIGAGAMVLVLRKSKNHEIAQD